MGKGKKAKAERNKKESDKPTPAEEELVAESAALTVSETAAPSASETAVSDQPSTSTSRETSAPPEADTAADDDDGGLGLGLGKARKKRPPKKKKQAVEEVKAGGDVSGPAASASVPETSVQPTPWGAQAPASAGPHPRPPAHLPPGFVPTPPGLQHGFPPAMPRPAYPGPPNVQPPGFQAPQAYPGVAQAMPGQPGPPQGFPPQAYPPQAYPPQAYPPQAYPPQAFPPVQMPQRGPHPQQMAFPRPMAQAPQPSPVPQQIPPVQVAPAQQRGPPPQRTAAPPQKSPAKQTPPPQQGDSAPRPTSSAPQKAFVSRYKIPDKIIGKSVRCQPVNVITNYLPMTIKPLKIYRYDVSFRPEKPKKAIPKAFEVAKQKLFPKHTIAFDQMKNCYSLTELPGVTADERKTINIEMTDRNEKTMNFEVSFKFTGLVDLGTIEKHMKSGGSSMNPPTEAIQCVDVILRQGTLESYVKAGRQFFKRPANPTNLGDGLEMWTGLFQSAIFTTRPFINIDVAHKGFPKEQPLIQALQKDFNIDPRQRMEPGWRSEPFQQFIKGLRVIAMIGGDSSTKGQKREFICNEVVAPPGDISFPMKGADGRETTMTVLDYFRQVKGIRLAYPNLNCLWVGVRDKKIYYPMEMLSVAPGQALNKQLNERQLSTMVREAATPPDQRKAKIEEVIRDMKYSANPDFKKFGLEISEKFFEVQAKVLTPPCLDVGARQPIIPRKGAWQASRLLKAEALTAWAIVAIEMDVRQSNGENIVTLMKNVGSRMGMTISEPLDRFYNTAMTSLKNVLDRAVDLGVKFVVIIVPTRGRDYYHRVKQLAERNVGILTQCIKEQTASRRMNDQTMRNILLKMNSKMMGINQAIDRQSMPACLSAGGVMVVGADVTHPSPDQSSVPSIAAVTASIDPRCFLYNIQLSVQTPKKEMIVEFEDMMREHLRVYGRAHKALPRKIFVFRDGVSEGQFAQVMESELQAVHRAYQSLSGPQHKPEVLFLLVQKRHHTRLFHADARNASYNVEPGTVVDKDIVHPRELDFYLVSHQAIKGTARPTRYHAVCNDGHIPHDEVEQLTFYLCHLYSRCMRSVSYPTPTYYAHLACLRARTLTFGERFNNADLEKNPQRLRVLDKMLQYSRMFFV